jgi:hypothetical protein
VLQVVSVPDGSDIMSDWVYFAFDRGRIAEHGRVAPAKSSLLRNLYETTAFPQRRVIRIGEPTTWPRRRHLKQCLLSSAMPVVVAIPVHNEAEHIEDCLAALARQN